MVDDVASLALRPRAHQTTPDCRHTIYMSWLFLDASFRRRKRERIAATPRRRRFEHGIMAAGRFSMPTGAGTSRLSVLIAFTRAERKRDAAWARHDILSTFAHFRLQWSPPAGVATASPTYGTISTRQSRFLRHTFIISFEARGHDTSRTSPARSCSHDYGRAANCWPPSAPPQERSRT